MIVMSGVAVGNDRDDTVRLVPRTFAGLRRYVGRHESGAAKTKNNRILKQIRLGNIRIK